LHLKLIPSTNFHKYICRGRNPNHIMTIQDILLPLENIIFRTRTKLVYSQRKYEVLITESRIVLYAERGRILKSCDVVCERLDALFGVEYSEKGTIFKAARMTLQGGNRVEIRGPVEEVKPLFNFIQSSINTFKTTRNGMSSVE
jgi:hypothetical protein